MFKPAKWTTAESKRIADCRVFDVTERRSEDRENSRSGTFYVIECPDWVNVLAITDNEEAVLIEQYRHGTEELTLEIPGGMVDRGESPEECARRELLEETGFREKEMFFLGKSRPNPAIQNNWIHHFLASGCVKTREPVFDDHESIATRLLPVSSLWEFIKSGKITHSLVIAGISMFENSRTSPSGYRYES